MRVLFVNRYFHPDESATSRMVSSLAFGLAAQGLQVEVLTGRYRHDDRSTVLPRCENIRGVRIHRVSTTRFGRHGLVGRAVDYASFQVAAAFWCLAHVRRSDVVIACTDPPLISVSLAAASAGRGGRLVNWLHDVFPEVAIELDVLARDGLAARITLALRNWSLRRARLNIVPTRSMAEGLRRWGVSDDRLEIIPYWSEDAVLPVQREGNRLRAAWGLRDDFVIGYSGNFGRAHEFQTLLDAATLLRDDPAIRFLLIGGGFGRGRVEAAIRQRELTNLILRPLQPRERLGESLSAADLHLISLLPSLEPYVVPSKFYGIMAAGRPAIFIGDAYGEVAVALRRNACGEVVAIGAARDLADRIVAIREDVARCARMGTNARKAFETLHTRDRAIAAWVDLLASIEKRGGHVPLARRKAPYSAASGDATKD